MDRGRGTVTAICLATFMLLLDITIVQVALPSIGREFGGGLSGLQWTIDAYVLPLAALVVSFGTLADRWGRRGMFLTGIVGFTLASIACGAAQSALALDVSRALQGLCGAAVFSTTLALIGQEFTGAARGRAIIVWGSTVGAAVATGPLLGGLITEAAGWRWIFLVNGPIGVLTVVLTLRYVGEGRDQTRRPLDVPGVVALTGGLALVTAGLLRGSASDWHTNRPALTAVGGGLLLVAFALLQRREGAMIDRQLYRSLPFVGLSFATLTLGAGMFAMLLFLNVFLQNALGGSPLEAGSELLPMSLPVLLVPLLGRRMGLVVVSGRTVGIGLVLVASGLLLMLPAETGGSWTRLVPGALVAGVGIGLANPAIAATALAVVGPTRSGLASGVSNACRIAGVTVGIAVLGVMMRLGISSHLGGSGAAHDRLVSLVATGQLRPAGRVSGHPALVAGAFDHGLHITLLTGAAIAAVGALACFVLVRRSALIHQPAGAPPVPERVSSLP